MNEQLVLQWLPGIIVVAAVAFPAFFFINRNFVLRLAAACVSVVAFLFLFGMVLGHQFSFARREDVPPLVLGVTFAWLLSLGCRASRTAVSRTRSS